MKIKAIIEKGKDGLYSVYSTQHLGNSYLGGFGDSVSAAKADFFESIREAYGEQGIPFTPEEIDVEYRYDVPSFFARLQMRRGLPRRKNNGENFSGHKKTGHGIVRSQLIKNRRPGEGRLLE